MWAKIITIKRFKDVNYFSLCAFNWFNTVHEFHNLSWITEINELFHYILIYRDAPVYICSICIYKYTLTGHFIRYTLLVPGWIPFCLQNCLNSLWQELWKIPQRFWSILTCSYCRFVGCTSMMRISRSTTSQRCSIGLRSGDCGGHLSEVNSLSCSKKQSEMIRGLWHGALSCWK